MAIDSSRALLDQLMGEGRNMKEEERYKKEKKFYHDKIDKYYLCGCSPYELFTNTKSDIGENPKIIDEKCKNQWDALTQREKDDYGYEYETHQFLESLVKRLDRQLDRNQTRVRSDEEKYLEEVAAQIVAIESSISEHLKQAKKFAKKGEIDEAYSVIELVKAGEAQKQSLMTVPAPEKKQIVCPISGNLLSSTDNDERLRAHFEGKQFIGWKKVRKFLKKYRANPPQRPRSRKRSDKRHRSYSRSHHRSRSRSRSNWRSKKRKDDHSSWKRNSRDDRRHRRY